MNKLDIVKELVNNSKRIYPNRYTPLQRDVYTNQEISTSIWENVAKSTGAELGKCVYQDGYVNGFSIDNRNNQRFSFYCERIDDLVPFVVVFNEDSNSISIAINNEKFEGSAKDLGQELWGIDPEGNNFYVTSPEGIIMTQDEFQETIEFCKNKFIEYKKDIENQQFVNDIINGLVQSGDFEVFDTNIKGMEKGLILKNNVLDSDIKIEGAKKVYPQRYMPLKPLNLKDSNDEPKGPGDGPKGPSDGPNGVGDGDENNDDLEL